MPETVPCPHCGKSLKLLGSVAGNTIRCPSCQQTFKAPSPTSQEELPEVLPAASLADPIKDWPVLEALPGDAGAEGREAPRAGNGRAVGVLLGVLAVLLVLCGGFGTLAFVIGKAVVNAVKPAVPDPEIANPLPPPQPTPNPLPNPNPQPNPQPNPNPTPVPAKERLERVGDRLATHQRGTQTVRTVPDGKQLAAVGEDGVVKLLELPPFGSDPMTYRVQRTFPAVEGPFHDLAFHPSSQMAIVAGDHVYIYNSFTGKLDGSLTYNEPIAAAFNPSGTLLAIAVRKPGDQGSEIHLWDTWRKRDKGKPLQLAGKVSDLAWPYGTYNLAVAVDGEVRLYHTPDQDWRYHHTIATRQGPILGLAFPQNGQSLATIGSDKTVKLWAQKDGKFLRAFEGATNPIGRPAFTPDGSRLAVLGGPGDGSVHLWHTATGTPQGTLVIAPAQAGSLDFLRDNRTLVIALRNGPIRFWSIPGATVPVRPARSPGRGKAEQPDEANRFRVSIAIDKVAFSPDGKTLAASDRGGELTLLNVADWTRREVKTSVAGPRVAGRGPRSGWQDNCVGAEEGSGTPVGDCHARRAAPHPRPTRRTDSRRATGRARPPAGRRLPRAGVPGAASKPRTGRPPAPL
jgi:WD40 repeat protein